MVSTRGKGDSKIKLENSVERRRSYSVRRNCILQNGGDFSLNSRTRQSFRNQKQSPGESWCFDDQQLKGYPNKEDNEYHDSSVTSPELPIGRAVQSPKSKSRYGKRRHDMRFRATTIVSPLRTRSFRRNSLNDPRKSTPIIKEIDSNDGEDEGDCEDDRETALNCESTPKSRVSSSTNLRRNRYPAKNNVENEDTYDDSNDHNWMEDSHVDTKTEDESSANDKAMEDGYGKSKRVRKPVVRLMYDNGTNYVRQLRPRRISSSSSSSDSEDEAATKKDKESYRSRSKYSLRQNKTSVRSYAPIDGRRFSFRQNRKDDLINSARKKKRFNKIYRATHNTDLSSTSSSSSSDEMEFEKRKSKSMKKARNQCLPMNFNPEDALTLTHRERQQIGRSLADIDPMYVDKSITFDSVGGLDEHVKSLKEMILFPLMYPEVFNKFNVTPPRGVLFYGCPGTGKTMVARALAAECSQKDKKVAFFMRKGADCLSKWVGESERQLRLLFDQAYQMRPSIIFFDEVDGLAPVRSSRQDQIHSSIVSTLLALMDGLDDRGQVIVIGATNRIDAIDPALRRPGRFDREFYFPLPSLEARKQILEIHTQKWSPKPEDTLLQYLAEETVGYCGADLKALCGEAALNALRSRYPQIYKSDKKLLLDVDTVQINRSHFNQSLGKLVPAGQRASVSACRKLDRIIEPLLQPWLKIVLKNLKHSFPHGFNKQLADRIMGNSKLLLAGSKGQGQSSHLAPAVLHALEGIPTYKLDFPTMCSSVTKSPEEACVHAFQEARRNAPSILYLPLIDHWWDMALDSLKTAFVCLIKQLDPTLPLLVLSTSETAHDKLPSDLKEMFNSYRSEVITLTYPKEVLRKAFFHPIFYVDMYKEPEDPPVSEEDFEELPLAPTPLPRQLNEHELKKVERKEESTLRELRIFLREICSKLAKNRMFYFFAKPVDLEEVPDYRDVISCPMDLETMMIKIDNHYYVCAEDFLNDVDLICSNALEYNPATNSEDKLIRHRACALRDTAYAYIKAEMDTDFEDNCQNIRKARQDRSQSNKNPTASKRESPAKAKETAVGAGAPNRSAKKRRRSTWARGLIKTPSSADKRRKVLESVNGHNEKEEKTEENTSNDVKENSVPVSEQNGAVITRKRLSSLSLDGASSPPDGRIATAEAAISVEDEVNVSGQKHTVKVIIDKRQLDSTYSKCVSVTEKCSVDDLYYLYTLIQRLIQEHIFVPNKTNLLNTVKEEVEKFAKSAVH